MKVAIVTPVYPPYRAGMSVLPEQEANMLLAAGHEVSVVTPAYGPGTAGQDGFVLRARPSLVIGNAAILLGLPMALRGSSVIHLHYPFFGTDILTSMAARTLRIPYVVTYHMKPVATGLKGLVFSIYRLLFERLVLRRAYRVLASSRDYAEACRVPRADIIAAPFGVSTDVYAPGDQVAARRALGLPESGPVAVFVGAMDPQHAFKGVPVLLSALAQAPGLTVILVGDGELRPEYEALASRLGVKDRAIFLGRLSEAQKVQAYQAADWHILPSTSQSEAFGLVTLEAMACGRASIVSDLPGVRTLIHEGENGVTVIPGDSASLTAALNRFLNDPALVTSLGLRARTLARELYAEEKVNAQLLAELTRAAQSHTEY